jgi:uncharacterized protein (TIGR03083 family)
LILHLVRATLPGMSDVERSIAAWGQTLDAVIALASSFDDAAWAAPTECPEWTVKDVYAHLVGGETWMSQGHPRPDNGLARIAGDAVAARRGATAEAVLAELRDVYAERQRQLHDEPEDPEAPTFTAYLQPTTVAVLLRMRAFDVWVHEQDIRRAVGSPGNLATGGAEISREIFLQGLARVVAKAAGAPPGSSVTLSISGELPFEASIMVDENRRGQLTAPVADPTVRIATDWETLSRLTAGRITPATASLEITGDRDLADRILASIAITP